MWKFSNLENARRKISTKKILLNVPNEKKKKKANSYNKNLFGLNNFHQIENIFAVEKSGTKEFYFNFSIC